MHIDHAPMTRAFIELLQLRDTDIVLDIGSGGGLALSLLAGKTAKAYGIDYSEVSVEKAREYNRKAVSAGKAGIQQASVLDMPFAAKTFSLITASGAVYFWDRVEDRYASIYRMLKPGGRFAMLFHAWLNGDRIVNEPERMDILRLNLHSPDQNLDDTLAFLAQGLFDIGIYVVRVIVVLMRNDTAEDVDDHEFRNAGRLGEFVVGYLLEGGVEANVRDVIHGRSRIIGEGDDPGALVFGDFHGIDDAFRGAGMADGEDDVSGFEIRNRDILDMRVGIHFRRQAKAQQFVLKIYRDRSGITITEKEDSLGR